MLQRIPRPTTNAMDDLAEAGLGATNKELIEERAMVADMLKTALT